MKRIDDLFEYIGRENELVFLNFDENTTGVLTIIPLNRKCDDEDGERLVTVVFRNGRSNIYHANGKQEGKRYKGRCFFLKESCHSPWLAVYSDMSSKLFETKKEALIDNDSDELLSLFKVKFTNGKGLNKKNAA